MQIILAHFGPKPPEFYEVFYGKTAAGKPIMERFVCFFSDDLVSGFFHLAVITSRSASLSMDFFLLRRILEGKISDHSSMPKIGQNPAMNRFGFQTIGNKSSCSPRFAEQCNLPDPNPFRTVLVGTNIFTLGLRLLAMNWRSRNQQKSDTSQIQRLGKKVL